MGLFPHRGLGEAVGWGGLCPGLWLVTSRLAGFPGSLGKTELGLHNRHPTPVPALAPGNSCACLFNLTMFQLLCWLLQEGTVQDLERRPCPMKGTRALCSIRGLCAWSV